MKPNLSLLLVCGFIGALLVGCADVNQTGITRREAIVIAKRACPEFPDQFAFVDNAEWVPEKGFWVVLLADQSGYHGRIYRINSQGVIIGTRDINGGPPPPGYYGGPIGGPPIVVGVYGPGWYHHRGWWH